MMKNIFCGAVASAGLFLCAEVVQADLVLPLEFHLTAEGTSTQDGTTIDFDATVVDQSPDLGWSTVTATLELDGLSSPFDLTGTFTLDAGMDGLLLADVSGVLFDSGGFSVTAGEWVMSSGTGIFAGLQGFGTFSSFTENSTGATQVKIGGTLIPAPAALSLLAVAGLFGTRRRRDR